MGVWPVRQRISFDRPLSSVGHLDCERTLVCFKRMQGAFKLL